MLPIFIPDFNIYIRTEQRRQASKVPPRRHKKIGTYAIRKYEYETESSRLYMQKVSVY